MWGGGGHGRVVMYTVPEANRHEQDRDEDCGIRCQRVAGAGAGCASRDCAQRDAGDAGSRDGRGAGRGQERAQRCAARLPFGHYPRTLVTRVGKLELRVPQDRAGRFSTELFERYQRSEQALVAKLAEVYVQGVSTRKVKANTEELCGHAFPASTISGVNKKLDGSLAAFAQRRLDEPFPYLILDARYEKVREGGVVGRQAVLIAIGIDWDGRRQRSEEHTSELQSLMRISYAVFCLKKKNKRPRRLQALRCLTKTHRRHTMPLLTQYLPTTKRRKENAGKLHKVV